MDILNNRELAISFWVAVLLVLFLIKKELRTSLKHLIKTFFAKQILISVSAMVSYVVIVVLILSQLGLWRPDQIKNTIFWFCSVALISLFNINDIDNDTHYFKNTLKNNLKIIVLIQFVISVYPFNFLVELIFVPFMVFLGAIIAVSSLKKEHEIVGTFSNKLLELFGAIIIVFTIYKLFTDFAQINQKKTLYDFIVPTLLSILYLPFLYILSIYVRYESAFTSLLIYLDDDKLVKYAKHKAIRSFKLDTQTLKKWCDLVVRKRPRNNIEIDNSIIDILSIRRREKIFTT